MEDNILKKIIQKKVLTDFIYENKHAVVIKDKFPQAKIHNLVLCKGDYAHLKDFLNEASKEEQECFFEAINQQLKQLPHAKVQFNIGKESGQEIFHLHAHIMSS